MKPSDCMSTAMRTAWIIASDVIEPMMNTPESMASGRSVEVRTDTAGKWSDALSSGSVPLSDTTQKAFC